MNRFVQPEDRPSDAGPDYSALEKRQTAMLSEVRRKRDATQVERALARLGEAAGQPPRTVKLMPLIIDAVRARATVGEISGRLATAWGFYRTPA